MERVAFRLEGLDGNAFNLLGAFRRAARRQGWTPADITTVCDEATAGDYDHLLATLIKYTESSDENENEDDQD